MKRLLFVDDEANVLQGLARMMRLLRQEWHIACAAGGAEAMELLSVESFDVVVSDMRMAGMSGGQFLAEVTRRFPQIVRIILSGQSDQESTLRSLTAAHRSLSKPCDAETLRGVILRACDLRDLLKSESLQKLTAQMHHLPSPPRLYTAIMDKLEHTETSAQEIAGIISEDVAMTAKILQVVNSAFFGCSRSISDATQAVNLLGMNSIKALALSAGAFSQFQPSNPSLFRIETLWRHSMQTATVAKAIAREQKQGQEEMMNAFTAGMLHDIGKLALSANLPAPYDAALKLAQEKQICVNEAEQAVFGTSHCEVGAYLMGLWGLSDTIVEAIAYHHAPRNLPEKGFSALLAVHAADALLYEAQTAPALFAAPALDLELLQELGFTECLGRWREVCRSVGQENAV